MENTQSSYHSSPLLFDANANSSQQNLRFAPHAVPPQTGYNVFINHRGADVKKTVASLVYHNLENKGYKVFLDKKSIQVGKKITKAIEHAIRTVSVHIASFSPNYADSNWCLNELCLMIKSGTPIIPVFCGVQPSVLRMKDKDGPYAQAFQMHRNSEKVKPGTLRKWKKALRDVSFIQGYIFKGDQGLLLERIASSVTQYIDCEIPANGRLHMQR